MSILDDIGNILSGGIGGIVKDVVGSFLPAKKMSEEERAQLTEAIRQKVADSEFAELKARLEDVASARAREVEIAKAGHKDVTPSILAYIAVGGFFGTVLYILTNGLGSMNNEQSLLVGSLLGVLGSNSTTVYSYYFGSSSGSKAKQEQLAKIQQPQ